MSEEHSAEGADARAAGDDDESYAVVFDGWKLIHNVITKDKPKFELFDHRADPFDMTNVFHQYPGPAKALQAELKAWRKMVVEAKLPDKMSTEGMSSEAINRLRSLGYIQ